MESIDANDDVMILGSSYKATIFDGENEEILYGNDRLRRAQTISSSLLDIGYGIMEEGEKLLDLLDEGKK